MLLEILLEDIYILLHNNCSRHPPPHSILFPHDIILLPIPSPTVAVSGSLLLGALAVAAIVKLWI
jgi:hypothetical protein